MTFTDDVKGANGATHTSLGQRPRYAGPGERGNIMYDAPSRMGDHVGSPLHARMALTPHLKPET